MIRYHVYHPVVAGAKRWGYYYTDHGKRRAFILHPQTRQPFQSREEVEDLLYHLRENEEHESDARLEEVVQYLFEPGGEWAQRRARRRSGRPLAAATLHEHAMIARLYIVPGLGKQRVSDIDWPMVDDWIYDIDCTNSFRRNIISTLRLVLKECVRLRIIKALPLLENPGKESSKPSTLTLSELELLFPADLNKLREIWTERFDKDAEGLAFAACSAAMFLGGARPPEARAPAREQLVDDIWALLITRSFDGSGKIQSYVKMANARDPRYRGTFLFLQGPSVMKAWLDVRPEGPFLFSWHGEPLTRAGLKDRLRLAIKRAGIPTEGRRFVPYSGRYTFETVVKPALPRDILMMLMGHIDPAMPEHYDVPVLLDRMHGMAEYREQANKKLRGPRVLPFASAAVAE